VAFIDSDLCENIGPQVVTGVKIELQ